MADADAATAGVGRIAIKRGALTVAFDPIRTWWNGRAIMLSPTEAKLMARLVRRGRLGWDEIDGITGSDRRSQAVFIYRIRRKFAQVGGADPIEAIRGWGVRLRVEPDAARSRALWIGMDEATARARAWLPMADIAQDRASRSVG